MRRMTNCTVKSQVFVRAPTCSLLSAEIMGIAYALEHARRTLRNSAQVHVATTCRATLGAIERGQRAKAGREAVQKVAEVIVEMESVGHKVTLFLVPQDKDAGPDGALRIERLPFQEEAR